MLSKKDIELVSRLVRLGLNENAIARFLRLVRAHRRNCELRCGNGSGWLLDQIEDRWHLVNMANGASKPVKGLSNPDVVEKELHDLAWAHHLKLELAHDPRGIVVRLSDGVETVAL